MKRKGTMRKSLVMICVMPIILIGIAVMAVGFIEVDSLVKTNVKDELQEIAYSMDAHYDEINGEYTIEKEMDGGNIKTIILKKGENNLSESGYIDALKENTNVEVTFFYGNMRIITTVSDDKNNKILYSDAPSRVVNDVLNSGKDVFYSGVTINGKKYYAYYMPIKDDSGKCIAMIGLAKQSDGVTKRVVKAIIPIVIVPLVFMIVAIFVSYRYADKIVKDIRSVRKYMREVSEHNFSASLPQNVYDRDDELYDIGKSTTDMKNSLRRLIEQDALTGLHNRRFGEVQFKNIWEKVSAQDIEFCLVMCDIDYFKKVNDTYGHEAGDEVLKMVADKLREGTSENGFAIRWGGEEFLLCFLNSDVSKTKKILENILQNVRDTVVDYGDYHIAVTMTFGLVEGDVNMSVDEVIKAADDKLYIGKESGRNRIIV